jgi:hypothetical protein
MCGDEVMRVGFAAVGLVIAVTGIGGAYFLMRGQTAPKLTPIIAAKVAKIPETESARLVVLSAQSIEPARPGISPAPKAAALTGFKDITNKKPKVKPRPKVEAKSASPNPQGAHKARASPYFRPVN